MKRARRWLYLLSGPSLAGGVIGALLVTRLDSTYFAALVPWLLLTAALLFLAESLLPKKPAADSGQRPPSAGATAGILIFQLVVAIYGGYFGAGASSLILGALAALRVGDVNQMNALKTVLGACINGISVVVFIADHKVAWRYALPMAAPAWPWLSGHDTRNGSFPRSVSDSPPTSSCGDDRFSGQLCKPALPIIPRGDRRKKQSGLARFETRAFAGIAFHEGGSPTRGLRPLLGRFCPLRNCSIRSRPPGTRRAAGAPRPPAPGRVPGLPVS
jgi:hypothetical protein